MSDDRATAALPVAAALVDAVAKRNEEAVETLLDGADWQALCVVLAELAGRGPSDRYVANVLHDLADQPNAIRTIARRYGLTENAVRAIRYANDLRSDTESPTELDESQGRWVIQGLVQVWRPIKEVA